MLISPVRAKGFLPFLSVNFRPVVLKFSFFWPRVIYLRLLHKYIYLYIVPNIFVLYYVLESLLVETRKVYEKSCFKQYFKKFKFLKLFPAVLIRELWNEHLYTQAI
jgi:hypothetical protein